MARSKNSQRDVSNSPLTPSLDSLLAYKIRPAPVLLPVPNNYLQQQQAVLQTGDRRLFQPDRSTSPPHAVTRKAARVQAGNSLNSLKFSDPGLVALCVRRKIRKEVIFALRKNKKGSGASRRKNFWSNISCKG